MWTNPADLLGAVGMPSLATHIHRRGGLYHLRCRVPKDLVQIVGRQEIRRSLGTASPSDAKVQAAKLYVRLTDAFEQIRQMESPKDNLIHLLMETLDLQAEVTAKQEANAATEKRIRDIRGAVSQIRSLEIEGLKLEAATRRVERLGVDVKAAIDEASPAAAERAVEAMRAVMTDLGVTFRNKTTPTVVEFLEGKYMREKKLQEDGRRHIVNFVKTFAKVAGDRQFPTYTRAEIVDWVRTLERLKNSLNKSPHDRDKTVEELLAESEGRPCMNATTVEKHITHVKAFFKTAVKHFKFATKDDIDELFDDIELSDFVPGARKRKPWSVPQLNTLFATPIWTGTAAGPEDFTKRHLPGPNIHRDAYWWLPVAALWSGARLEEIAQLHHEDLRMDRNGLPFIKIHDEGIRRVKTPSSIREVPVHSALVSFGFLDLFDPAQRGTRIFPELPPSGRLKKFGDMYSTHFTDYRRRTGNYEFLRDFHSFRRTFIGTLRNHFDADILKLAAMVGHDEDLPDVERFRQTDDYTDYDIGPLSRVIEKLDYAALGLDLSPFQKG